MDNETPVLGTLVLAAGKGKRMNSSLPKVMHTVLGRPMLGYALAAAPDGSPVAAVVGHGWERLRDYLSSSFPSAALIRQEEQRGTGHAVKVARPWWEKFKSVLVLNGDLPLLRRATVQSLVEFQASSGAACVLLSFTMPSPRGYGHVVRSGETLSIVEDKDATPAQRKIQEVNGGCYVFDARALASVIDGLSDDNAQNEYYLPDAVNAISAGGGAVAAIEVDSCECLGVNTQADLAKVTRLMRGRILSSLMEMGVRFMDADSAWVGPDAEVEPDVEIMSGAVILGKSFVGRGSVVGVGCVLNNARLGAGVRLAPYVVVEDSELKDGASAGPFAYVRGGSVLSEEAFAGKFVELKNTAVGRGSKVAHLSYMGDAVIGELANVGAGTITCNYDGVSKLPTKIGDRCFVGSDTMLVAPVSLGADSTTAAGSAITADVPDGALAVGRARQRNIEGWASRKTAREA
ncbi:MAG: bifunctional UDP-N-acetylglucosamine diphosphorylase/glucosamine-1-phosphate N-acetyltransferase GlmU [Synergistaceae bacterium]|nr:bifunctional UDP-N-acetylglucosamine diphosphorylase/glucosamine-1-phosphate N-acetyltransferase GlmU [Synergistaceae bacterium]